MKHMVHLFFVILVITTISSVSAFHQATVSQLTNELKTAFAGQQTYLLQDLKTFKTNDVNEFSSLGKTRLHYAILAGNQKVFQALIDHGADPLLATKDGKTPYQLAQEAQKCFPTYSPQIIGYLFDAVRQPLIQFDAELQKKAQATLSADKFAQVLNQLSEFTTKTDINERTAQGMTRLHLAALVGDTDLVKQALKMGADREIKNSAGHTAFAIADDLYKNTPALFHPLLRRAYFTIGTLLKTSGGLNTELAELARHLQNLHAHL